MLVVLSCTNNSRITTQAFSPSFLATTSRPTNLLSLQAAATKGMGMGMGGAATKTKKPKKAKGGMGKKNGTSKTSTAFDASASLLRLEKKFDEMQQASNKALHAASSSEDDDTASDTSGSMMTSEMVVTVRAVPSKSAATADWVPVAQLCLHPHSEVSSQWAQAAISLYCRELSFAATLGSKLFASVPRQDLQYAIEPVDSFYKHVYDPIMETKANSDKKANNALESMTKAEARDVLELDTSAAAVSEDDQKSQIKQAYRKQSFQWHPDRLDKDLSPEDVEAASHQYARIQKAYELLTSGIRSSTTSWYASLGGRERTDFRVIDLLGRDDAASILERFKVTSAVVGLDPEVTQSFLTRNQASSKQMMASSSSS